MKRPLRVMKFGGTSVGEAAAIGRVVEIVRQGARESSLLVVVSAMSGVTNRLLEAAQEAKAENDRAVAGIFAELDRRHDEAAAALVHSARERQDLQSKLRGLFAEGERLCRGTSLLRELTPRTLDAIAGLGERLSASLVAAALADLGLAAVAVEATELVVTDSHHGAAEPWMDLTRARCRAHALPILEKGMVPVVTGFIAATEEGVATTLGRGGSDYSATILGAALDADEIIIWSDVPGLLTADPRLVEEAATIPEISYREAAELAYFGAKVLHPKTLRPVMARGIPLWIRNTFAPGEAGTRITPNGPANTGGVKALAAIREASLITVAGPDREAIPDALARTASTAAAVRADVLLISQSSSHNDICLVIPSAAAKRTVEALRHEFSPDLMHERVEHTVFDAAVSVITLVGQNLRAASDRVARTFAALGQENVEIVAAVHGASDCSLSLVVRQEEMARALVAIHRELDLPRLTSPDHQPDQHRDGQRFPPAAGAERWKFPRAAEPASAD
jgi:aspartate kinase